jgi:transcriptional regulator with XRE-family HTH domain
MSETNFDRYLRKQLENPVFARRFEKAGIAIDIALQLTRMREDAGYSQAQLAKALNTSQQQISRLESINYEGHSLSMLRRIAEVLDSKVVVRFEKNKEPASVHEPKATYKPRRKAAAKKTASPTIGKKAPKPIAKKAAKRTVKKSSKKTAKKR